MRLHYIVRCPTDFNLLERHYSSLFTVSALFLKKARVENYVRQKRDLAVKQRTHAIDAARLSYQKDFLRRHPDGAPLSEMSFAEGAADILIMHYEL